MALCRISKIDTDFSQRDRGAVKQYMEERYGIDQVCSVGTYATLQVKAALKDLAKNKGVSFQEVRKLSNKLNMEKQSIENFLKIACSDRSVSLFINTYPEILDTIELIYGQPKNKSIHACAMMIYPSEKTMFEWAPISKQKGMMVSEWEGGELDAAGFLKEDILGIQQLDKLSDIISLIKENFNGKVINLYDIPKDDQKVFEYFQKGWTGDVFHFGAAGLTGYCKQLKPDNITDLINCIGLYRPGVMESNFHNEYILRKTGERYSEARVGAEEILRETQNVMIWQEQTMKMFQKLGGFDLVESDTARRSIGKKDVSKLLAFKERFIEHYMKNYGVDYGYAEETWGEIEHMSSYQFNKSHAVCYALTGYACQWLKVHYPLEYWAVTFSYAKDDDYPIYLSEIGEMGVVSILTPDINESIDKIRMDMDKKKFYWPLSSVKQVGEKAIEEILRERNQSGPYFSLSDFIDRHNFKGSKVNKSVVENLILTGAFDGVENVTNLTSRLKLIHYYHDIKKIKQTEKSIFMDNPKVNFDWWYTLQQKILCGFAFFDYKKIYTQYSELFEDGISVGFKSVDEVDTLSSINRKEVVVVGGYVYDMAVKQSRKGMYCRLKLEQNYKFIDVLVWTEQYEDFEEILGECDGKILFVSGNLVWNDRDNSYSLHTSSFTKMALLT